MYWDNICVLQLIQKLTIISAVIKVIENKIWENIETQFENLIVFYINNTGVLFKSLWWLQWNV